MESTKVAKTFYFSDLKPVFVEVDGTSIAVYRFRGCYYAYTNRCPHEAGPACEGIVVGNVEAELLCGGRVREYTSSDKMNIVCPWHGVEFDLESGVCCSDPRYRLASHKVVVEGDEVSIVK